MKKKEGEKATVKVTFKKSVEDTQEDLMELFHSYIKRFKQHHFNIKQQYALCRELKKNMSREVALIHVDCSENYSCKYSSRGQVVHFGASHQQATLHTGVLYVAGLEAKLMPFYIKQCILMIFLTIIPIFVKRTT